MNDELSVQGMTRSTTDRVVAGVAGGIGAHFQVDPAYVRMSFAVASLVWGFGILAYALLWVMLPTESVDKGEPDPPLATDEPQKVLGVLFLALGLILVAWRLLSWISFGVLLPVALVGVGLFLLSRRR